MDQDQDQDQDQDMEISHNMVVPKSQFEMEWDVFEHDVLGPLQQLAATTAMMGNGADGATTATTDLQETYVHMTIAVEPKMVPRFIGLPEGVVQGSAARRRHGLWGGRGGAL
ncbi:hypothetical protein F5148DRAFT_1151516 [Russula earlei]|uniref:Uncharacterized protein n=1 Tax=Russula earlei TaxID=71964 RepID=A0ACC0U0R2_9AGAM|nr:hypothetical protein F5148DRAFT_1151516 [Russula earlei]